MRISQNSLSFSTLNGREVLFECYPLKNSISLAANLREALRQTPLLQESYQRVTVLTDSPILLVPTNLFQEEDKELLYRHTFTGQEQRMILYSVVTDLNAVAVFSIQKDLRQVITDRFSQTTFVPLMAPVWRHLHQKSFTGNHAKLYGYAHDHRLEVFNYQQCAKATEKESLPEFGAQIDQVMNADSSPEPTQMPTPAPRETPRSVPEPTPAPDIPVLGNIDIYNRTPVVNPDGSISTVDSFSVNIDGKEVLLPTIIAGKRVSQDEAIDHYYETGEYLGKFDTVAEADDYAQRLHEQQERLYGDAAGRILNTPAPRETPRPVPEPTPTPAPIFGPAASVTEPTQEKLQGRSPLWISLPGRSTKRRPKTCLMRRKPS